MSRQAKTIGIVGGLGPESTIEYYRQFIARYRGHISDGSNPPMKPFLKDALELVHPLHRATHGGSAHKRSTLTRIPDGPAERNCHAD